MKAKGTSNHLLSRSSCNFNKSSSVWKRARKFSRCLQSAVIQSQVLPVDVGSRSYALGSKNFRLVDAAHINWLSQWTMNEVLYRLRSRSDGIRERLLAAIKTGYLNKLNYLERERTLELLFQRMFRLLQSHCRPYRLLCQYWNRRERTW